MGVFVCLPSDPLRLVYRAPGFGPQHPVGRQWL